MRIRLTIDGLVVRGIQASEVGSFADALEKSISAALRGRAEAMNAATPCSRYVARERLLTPLSTTAEGKVSGAALGALIVAHAVQPGQQQ